MPLPSWLTPSFSYAGPRFRAEHNPAAVKMIGREPHRDLIPWKNPDIMHTHLSRNIAKHLMAIFQPDAKCCVWEVFSDLALHLNDVVFSHCLSLHGQTGSAAEVCLFHY